MRFSSTIALAALAACQGVVAQQPEWTGQGGAPGPEESAAPTQWSTMTTYYTTRTVLRVVETIYATKNSSTYASSTATVLSAAPTPYGNATTTTAVHGSGSGSGSGAGPSSIGPSSVSPPAVSSSSSAGVAVAAGAHLGFVAIAGLAGLLAL